MKAEREGSVATTAFWRTYHERPGSQAHPVSNRVKAITTKHYAASGDAQRRLRNNGSECWETFSSAECSPERRNDHLQTALLLRV